MAALWALPEDCLEQYLTLRKPSLIQTDSDVHVGRANLSRSVQQSGRETGNPAKALRKQVRNVHYTYLCHFLCNG